MAAEVAAAVEEAEAMAVGESSKTYGDEHNCSRWVGGASCSRWAVLAVASDADAAWSANDSEEK